MIKVADDGHPYHRPDLHLWGQYVCNSQHPAARIYTQEEVE